jgi:hypothetical protein
MLLDPTETLRFAHDYDSWQKKCPRYGGSMLYLMLRREGFVVNHSGLGSSPEKVECGGSSVAFVKIWIVAV